MKELWKKESRSNNRDETFKKLLLKAIGEYIQTVSNRQSLITPTDATVSPDGRRATVYISIIPSEQEETALAFLRRHEREAFHYLTAHMQTRRVPGITFEVDYGEKNRQRIDEVLRDN